MIDEHIGLISRDELLLGAILHAIHRSEERTMGALEDLQAAVANLTAQDATLVTSVTDLATEQVTFLRDVADALANAGTDPTTLNQITATLNTKADDLAAQAASVSQLMADQVAADPANQTPPAAAEPTPVTDTPPDTTVTDTPPDVPVDMTNAAGNASAG